MGITAKADKRGGSLINPRGDISSVDPLVCDSHVLAITEILRADKEEHLIADDLKVHVRTYLNPHPELWIAVNDQLAKSEIISKANLRKVLSLTLEVCKWNSSSQKVRTVWCLPARKHRTGSRRKSSA
jgi:hypothetical protein